jgi:hypothetical protein
VATTAAFCELSINTLFSVVVVVAVVVVIVVVGGASSATLFETGALSVGAALAAAKTITYTSH